MARLLLTAAVGDRARTLERPGGKQRRRERGQESAALARASAPGVDRAFQQPDLAREVSAPVGGSAATASAPRARIAELPAPLTPSSAGESVGGLELESDQRSGVGRRIVGGCEPVGFALVQSRAVTLGEPVVGGVANQSVPEPQGVGRGQKLAANECVAGLLDARRAARPSASA